MAKYPKYIPLDVFFIGFFFMRMKVRLLPKEQMSIVMMAKAARMFPALRKDAE